MSQEQDAANQDRAGIQMSPSRKSGRDHYRRNYRACNLCRRKKIRCDLGDLDNPEPPCAKCRREKKVCVIDSGTAYRLKRPRMGMAKLLAGFRACQLTANA